MPNNVTYKYYGPNGVAWSNETKEIFYRIENAIKKKVGLNLTASEVDRLGGALWNLGVFK